MSDSKNDPASPLLSESVVSLFNRLRKHGPSAPPEAEAIGATNRLVEHLRAAIAIWAAASSRADLLTDGSPHADLDAELAAFRTTLTDLSDRIKEMGGSATEELDRELREAIADIDWAGNAEALQAVLGRARTELLAACTAAAQCEEMPPAIRHTVDRLAVALRPPSP